MPQRIAQVQDHVKSLEKELGALKVEAGVGQGDELVAQAVDVKGLKVLAAKLEGADAKTLRETVDKLKDKLKSAAIVLAAVEGGKVQPDRRRDGGCDRKKVKAGELVNFVAQQVGGKGGGTAGHGKGRRHRSVRLAAALAGAGLGRGAGLA